MEIVLQNESLKKKKKSLSAFCAILVTSGEGEKNADIPEATLVTNKSQRSPSHKVASKLPHTVLNLPSQFFIYFFSF